MTKDVPLVLLILFLFLFLPVFAQPVNYLHTDGHITFANVYRSKNIPTF